VSCDESDLVGDACGVDVGMISGWWAGPSRIMRAASLATFRLDGY
jgi:hypothetical protein